MSLRGGNFQRVVSVYAGTIRTIAGLYSKSGSFQSDGRTAVTAKLKYPRGVALTRIRGGGRIFISDSNNNRIRMLFLKTEPKVYGP